MTVCSSFLITKNPKRCTCKTHEGVPTDGLRAPDAGAVTPVRAVVPVATSVTGSGAVAVATAEAPAGATLLITPVTTVIVTITLEGP